jgi:cytochrome c-type biogenesis protein CcmH/NrfF
MPSWILWLSPVVVAPMLAVVWISWAARPRGPVEAMETVEQYDRFKAALRQPVPGPRSPRAARSKAKARQLS